MDSQAEEESHEHPGGARSLLAWRRHQGVPLGTPCYNCETPLLGPWCHSCGQSATDFHRHAHHLIAEAFESFSHADGRFWRTVPRLLLHPSRLTRDYLAGKRAAQIPPLRLFLVTLLILFLAGGWVGRDTKLLQLNGMSPAQKAELSKIKVDLGLGPAWNQAAGDWLQVHLGRAIENPQALSDGMRERAHDFAFLLLPISAFILAGIFMFRRGFVLFDHLIFSMHSLSFQGLLISTAMLGSMLVSGSAWLLWAAPVHLFVHMRGTYGTGVFGTLVRMLVLFLASVIGFAMLLAALVLIGLQELRA